MMMKKWIGLLSALWLGMSLVSAQTPAERVGDSLQDNRGRAAKSTELEDKKLVAYYFSASWCPPCRSFTPELVRFYHRNKKDMEIVLVSWDKSEEAHLAYLREYRMPWKALKWKSDEAEALFTTYAVKSIPTLVVVDAKGNEISRKGRQEVTENPRTAFDTWLAEANSLAEE